MRMGLLVVIASMALASGPCVAQSKKAPPTVILVPGAGGAVASDFLIRNQGAFSAAGFTTQVATSSSQALSATRSAVASGQRAVLVGMSAGAPMVGEALAGGAPVVGAVFVSGILLPGSERGSAMEALGSPAALPATLIVHNRHDQCPLTSPEAAQRFAAWAKGKAKLVMVNAPSQPARPCGPMGAHGYFGQDERAIEPILSFLRRL